MNLKSLVYLVLFFIYCLFCWKYYTCDIKGFCNDTKDGLITEVEASSPPVQFYKNSDAELLFGFENYCDSIKNISLTTRLDIVGQYYSDEVNSTLFENLGLARANKLKTLLINCGVDSTKLNVLSEIIEGSYSDSIQVVTAINPSQVLDMKSNDVQIMTNNGLSEIHFPSNSTKEMTSETLNNFLKETVANATGKKIYLTGHTDNVGSESANKSLSINRCISIKKQLLKLGAEPNQVLCEGKGSQSPKVDNSSEENRAMNRRVEVTIQ